MRLVAAVIVVLAALWAADGHLGEAFLCVCLGLGLWAAQGRK
jgi:hypothetical protein